MDLEENRDGDTVHRECGRNLRFCPHLSTPRFKLQARRRLDWPHAAHMSRVRSDFGLDHIYMSSVDVSGLKVVGRIHDLTVLLLYTPRASPFIVHRRRLLSHLKATSVSTRSSISSGLELMKWKILEQNIDRAIAACRGEGGNTLQNRQHMEQVRESLEDGYCDISGRIDDLDFIGTSF